MTDARRGTSLRRAFVTVSVGLAATAVTVSAQPTPPGRAPDWHPSGERLAFESDDRSPSWSPDGGTLVIVRSSAGSSSLHLLDPATGNARAIEGTVGAMFPDWSPDGRSIAFSVERGGTIALRSVDPSTGNVRDLLTPAGRDVWPRWSPSGEALAFFSRRDTGGLDDEVYVWRSWIPERLAWRTAPPAS